MFWFGRKTKSYLGVDIGTSAIKIVELEKEEGRYSLINYGIYPLGDYLRQLEGQIGSEVQKIANEEIAEMLKRIIDKAGVKTKESFFSVPVYSSFSTLIDLPAMPKKEIASAINYEAKKYIPVPVSEVVLDWALVNPLERQVGHQVLLVAVPKDIISDYSQIANIAKLHLNSLEAETFSMSRALIGNDRSSLMLIDVGARSTNISVVDGGNIRVIHNLEIGGIKLTENIAKQRNLSQLEAEKLKKDLLSKGQGSSMGEALNSFLESIASRIKKIADSYQSKYNRRLEKCILTGGSMQIPGMMDYISKSLGIGVSFGNPFARVVCPPELKPLLPELAPLLTVAIGLAMR